MTPPKDQGVRVTVEIVNKKGLHARAAALFTKVAGGYDAGVSVTANGHTVTADSIMELLTLGAACGTRIEISVTGRDAAAAAAALVRLVKNCFEEDDFPGC